MTAPWPPERIRVADVEELRDRVRSRAGEEPRWMPLGTGGRLGRGLPPEGAVRGLDLTGLDRIVEVARDDLTVTVEAGVLVKDLVDLLASGEQWLPCAVPAGRGSGTVGGMIGADRRSLLAGSAGSVRDHLLGIRWVDGEGRLLKAGARVVKSVAGYDLMKVMTGSLGQYGALVEATFKVLPAPEVWGGVVLSDPGPADLAVLLDRAPREWAPLGSWLIDDGAGSSALLVFAGRAERVTWQCATSRQAFGGEVEILEDTATREWLDSLQDALRGLGGLGWGGVLPGHVAEGRPAVGGVRIVDLLGGHLWWAPGDPAGVPGDLERLRGWAAAGEGRVHFDAPAGARPDLQAWDPGAAPSPRILTGLREALDPAGTWVRGRHPGGI